ncbi:MAG TPA: hypothetical protein VE983_01090, partial [Solirubrobacteraceae bacterium]|nr:hypothetical protein [Solirubrobacteraceae bacterium]
WGRVTPDGLCIPFHLTHEVLGEIIGARRPSVSVAVGNLRRRDEIFRRDDGFFVLSGDVNQLMAKVTEVIGGNTAQPDGVD